MIGASPAWRVAGAALVATLGGLALAGAVAIAAGRDGWTLARAAIAVATIAAAWWRPVPTACALLALAPLFGNRPTTPQYVWLIWLTALAVPAWLVRLATIDRAVAARVLGSPVGVAALAYLGASVLSLSSLPLYALPEIVGAATIDSAIAATPRALVTADVMAWAYPVLTVVLALHAAVAALIIAVAIARHDDDASRVPPAVLVAAALAVGLVLAVGVGLLDSFALVDLRRLRAFDPFTNASGALRMQSTFGHAGWFAEYVCFTTPALLVVWLARLRLSTASRAVLTGGLLGASLVVIVLSYQRGGWITWLVVGTGVALVALRWSGLASGSSAADAGHRVGRRVAVAGLAVVVVALGLGLGVVRIAGGSGAMARFAERVRLITQVSDRRAHVVAGLRLGSLLPVLGGGSDSFAIRYREEYLLSGGEYYARGYSPVEQMYGSAHNVFAQTFAGKGAAGLLALVLVVAGASWAAWRTARDGERSDDARLLATIALGTLGAFTLYGQVQEVFYIQALQLTVFAAIALAVGLAPLPPDGAATLRRAGLVAILLLIVLAAHVAHAWIAPGRLAEGYHDREISRAGARLGAPEPDGEGGYFQWTGGAAFVTVPRQATALSFDLRSLGPEPQVVEVRLDDRLVDRVRLDTHAWRHVEYPLGKLRELPRRLHLAVQPTWREPGGTRELGVTVRRLRWGTE